MAKDGSKGKQKTKTVECPYCLKQVPKASYPLHSEEHERNNDKNQLNSD